MFLIFKVYLILHGSRVVKAKNGSLFHLRKFFTKKKKMSNFRLQCTHNCHASLRNVVNNYIIIRVHSAFSLVASCALLKYTRMYDVN